MPYDSVDEDDDFQSPSQAIAITQNLILSSLKNPNSSEPLKQSNGAPPPRKRQKPSASNGKENRRSKQVTKSNSSRVPNLFNEGKVLKAVNLQNGENSMRNSRIPRDLEEGEAVGEKRRQLSGSVGSGSLVSQSSFVSDSCISSICDDDKMSTVGDEVKDEKLGLLTCGNSNTVENWQNGEFVVNKEARGSFYLMSIESRLLEPRTKLCSLNVEDGFGNVDLMMEEKNLKSVEEFDFGKLDGCEDKMCLKAGKGGRYLNSIESRLLESRVKCDSTNNDVCDGDFEPGTQLNVLMDLCNDIGEGCLNDCDSSFEENGLGDESFQLETDGFVECPLCGADITHLSEELRQVHTNDCLDKDVATEVALPACEIKSHSPHPFADVDPVLEWLRALGLSRYEEAFVKEEVDWETLQWLTEEDLLSMGVVALGPRKKIVHALNELRQKGSHGQGTENDNFVIPVNENTKGLAPGNKLITEYFPGSAIGRNRPSNQSNTRHGIEKASKDSVRKRGGPRNHASRGKVRDMPPWCHVPGTPFRVDAFRFLRGDCSYWFLTHFHMDHYQGLTKNFCHGKIYCSSVTAHLLNIKIGVPWERLQILPLNQKLNVAGVNLTCLDANHCPGSIMILFEPPNGKAVLHTGDFRFSAEMADYSVLQSCHVHTLVLDTTYCNPQYDFPKQEAVIQFVIEAIQAEAFNPKTLFLIGTYTIGKERLFLEVARLLKRKVYVGAAKLRLLRCLELPEEDMQWLTANENESHIHVVPMWTIASFKRMKHISNQYTDRFNLIVAFSPTGWTFGKGKKKTPGRRWQQGTIIRYEVPYSEHSSFTELREFVKFISPEHIIPSVNNEGPESADAMISLLKPK